MFVSNRSGAERGSGCICADRGSNAPIQHGLQFSVFDLKQDSWMHIVAAGYRADEPNFLSQHLRQRQQFHQDCIETSIFQVMQI